MWMGGGNAGNGAVQNSNPYAHWAYDAQDTLTANPSYKCIIANYYRRYDMVGRECGGQGGRLHGAVLCLCSPDMCSHVQQVLC
jgi:hypothetical protein